MSAGIFVPYGLLDTLGPRDLAVVFVAAAIEHLHRTQPFTAADGDWVRMSVRELAEATHLTVNQVRRATDLLTEAGILERRNHRLPGGGELGQLPYSYRLAPQVSAVAA